MPNARFSLQFALVVVIGVCSACPNLQTYTAGPGPAPRVAVECDESFIASQQAPFDERALSACYTTPYAGYPTGCAQCHESGSPDGVGSGWGANGDVSATGWYVAVVGNALTSDLGNLARTDLVRTLVGGEAPYHPAQPVCAESMTRWLESFASGCGGDPLIEEPLPDAGVTDGGVVDGGGGPPIDAGPIVIPDAGPCPDGGPWPDDASLEVFTALALPAKLNSCHTCHRGTPEGRNGAWGTPLETASPITWHTAARSLLEAQSGVATPNTSLVQKIATQHLNHAPDPVAAANMTSWIDFVRTCQD